MPKLFGREPALLLAFFASAVQFLSAQLLPLTDGQQGALNAAAAAVVGIVVAWKVSAETAVPLLAGGLQALLALALAFGFNLTADVQSGLMALFTTGLAFVVRALVVAPVNAAGLPRAGV